MDDARVEDGRMHLPDLPGIGFEGQGALYRIMADLAS
jgi:L-alanine-DL-glutamate epimerase-like enolase superfamily enzyme